MDSIEVLNHIHGYIGKNNVRSSPISCEKVSWCLAAINLSLLPVTVLECSVLLEAIVICCNLLPHQSVTTSCFSADDRVMKHAASIIKTSCYIMRT